MAIVSTRGRYALRVMIDLAENNSGAYIPLMDIALRQDISEKYLESILSVLSRHGLLLALRGRGGGYRLARAPEDYTAYDILRLTESSLSPVSCLEDDALPCPRAEDCRTLSLWSGLDKVIINYLGSITLADLVREDLAGGYVI